MLNRDKPYQLELRLRNCGNGRVVAGFMTKLQTSDDRAWAIFNEVARHLAAVGNRSSSERDEP